MIMEEEQLFGASNCHTSINRILFSWKMLEVPGPFRLPEDRRHAFPYADGSVDLDDFK